MTVEKISPGMQRYLDIKKTIRMPFVVSNGRFYELFYEDAVNAASNFRDFLNLTE